MHGPGRKWSIYRRPAGIIVCGFIGFLLIGGVSGVLDHYILPDAATWTRVLAVLLFIASIYAANRTLKNSIAQADCDDLVADTMRRRALRERKGSDAR